MLPHRFRWRRQALPTPLAPTARPGETLARREAAAPQGLKAASSMGGLFASSAFAIGRPAVSNWRRRGDRGWPPPRERRADVQNARSRRDLAEALLPPAPAPHATPGDSRRESPRGLELCE